MRRNALARCHRFQAERQAVALAGQRQGHRLVREAGRWRRSQLAITRWHDDQAAVGQNQVDPILAPILEPILMGIGMSTG